MLNLFGKSNSSSSAEDQLRAYSDASAKAPYSIFLGSTCEIQFVSFGLKEYFLVHNIYDAKNVLPPELKSICQSVLKTNASEVIKHEYNGNIWAWEFSIYADKSIVAELLNYKDFDQADEFENNIESEQLNEEIFGNVPISLCVTSIDSFDLIYANSHFYEMFKQPESEHSLDDISAVIQNNVILQDIKISIADIDEVRNVLFLYNKSGGNFWESSDLYVSTNVKKSHQMFGNVLVWTFQDISEYKQLQQQHEQFKKKFNSTIEAATEGIWEWSKLKENGDWWSKPMYTLLGLNGDIASPSLEMIKRLMHPKDRKKYDYLVDTEIRSNQHFTFECRLTVKEKGFRWFRMRVVGAFDSHGDINKLIGSLVNIHSEKTNRIQLQQEKDKAIATLNSIVDAVITTNEEGVIEYKNSAAERLTGVPRNESKGSRIDQIISFFKEHSTVEIRNPILECLDTGEQMKQKIYADMLDRDGTRYTVQVMATPLVRKDGKVFGAVLVLNDVTNIRILSRHKKYIFISLKNKYRYGIIE